MLIGLFLGKKKKKKTSVEAASHWELVEQWLGLFIMMIGKDF